MHFCMTAQYTPKALNGIMENPQSVVTKQQKS
jgi:hypothetical protein